MTDAAGIVRLAERVEQVTGATPYDDVRALEDAIYTLQTGKVPFNCATAPRYTRSLDAAMTLVPEGWYSSLTRYPHAFCVADIGGIYSGKSTSPALAVTAAALKARARAAQHDHEVG